MTQLIGYAHTDMALDTMTDGVRDTLIKYALKELARKIKEEGLTYNREVEPEVGIQTAGPFSPEGMKTRAWASIELPETAVK